MSLYFSVPGDEQVTSVYTCQCRTSPPGVTDWKPGCSECKGTSIVQLQHDAHGFAWSATSASYVLALLGLPLNDHVAVVPVNWETYDELGAIADALNPDNRTALSSAKQDAVRHFGGRAILRDRLFQLRDLVLFALARNVPEIVGA